MSGRSASASPVRHRARYRAVTAAALLALVVAACGQNAPSPVPAASPAPFRTATATPNNTLAPTVGPSPTPTASPTLRALRPGEDDWGRVPFANGLRDRYGSTAINAMAEAGGRIVAVGRGPTGAAAWVSTDGINWMRAPDDPSFHEAAMSDVVAGGAGFVAVGGLLDTSEDEDLPATTVAVWTSADGLSWQRAAVADPGGAFVERVLVSDGVLAAFGHRGPPDGETVAMAVWTSPDGASWQPASVPGPAGSSQSAATVGVGPPGIVCLVNVTSGEPGEETYTEVGYVIEGGTTWRAGTNPRPPWGSEDITDVSSVAWDGDHFLAVGSVANPQRDVEDEDSPGSLPAAWTSPDGLSWTWLDLVIDDSGAGDPPQWFASIVATSDGRLLASSGYDNDSRLWISDEGAAWSAIPPFSAGAAQLLNGMTSVGGRLVAFGAAEDAAMVSDGYDAGEDAGPTYSAWGTMLSAAIWTNPSPGLPEPTPEPASCPGTRPAVERVIALSPAQRLRCFGSRPITFRAYVDRYPIYAEGPIPMWLISADDGTGHEHAARPLAVDHPWPVVSLPLHVAPASEIRRQLPDGDWAWVTGRFDHPKATTCPADLQARCRQAFVVTKVRPAEAP